MSLYHNQNGCLVTSLTILSVLTLLDGEAGQKYPGWLGLNVCETILCGITLQAKGPHIYNLQLRASYSTVFKTLLDNVDAKKKLS